MHYTRVWSPAVDNIDDYSHQINICQMNWQQTENSQHTAPIHMLHGFRLQPSYRTCTASQRNTNSLHLLWSDIVCTNDEALWILIEKMLTQNKSYYRYILCLTGWETWAYCVTVQRTSQTLILRWSWNITLNRISLLHKDKCQQQLLFDIFPPSEDKTIFHNLYSKGTNRSFKNSAIHWIWNIRQHVND